MKSGSGYPADMGQTAETFSEAEVPVTFQSQPTGRDFPGQPNYRLTSMSAKSTRLVYRHRRSTLTGGSVNRT